MWRRYNPMVHQKLYIYKKIQEESNGVGV
jgi:hypothetical protein